jgi:acyl CoA:acetate/3-ketoacid CoA transferase alpha subunit
MPKFASLEEAVSQIQDNMELIVGGFSTYGCPESCSRAWPRAMKPPDIRKTLP